MGLILDTSVLIAAEREQFALQKLFQDATHDRFLVSAVSASELLVGYHRARDLSVRARRGAFVQLLLAQVPVVDFGLREARVHGELVATLADRGSLIGPHDGLIAATALAGGHALATLNQREFTRVPGLSLVDTTPYAIA